MKARKPIAWVGCLAAVWVGIATAPAIWAAAAPDSGQVNNLLANVKTAALQVKEDTVAMEAYSRMNVSWEAHAIAINQVKDHVNALGQALADLNAVRDLGSPWQQTAIARMTPFLDELVGYTYAVIEHVNDQPKRLLTDEYKDYLAANADYATDLAALVSNFVDYGRSRERVERLAAKLEVRN